MKPKQYMEMKAKQEARHDELLGKFLALEMVPRLRLLDTFSVWGKTARAIQGQADEYLECGKPFDDALTMALAMIEYTRPGTRPQARMGALRMIEGIQRRQAATMKARVLARVRELDGIERGWLADKDRSRRTASTARRKRKDQDQRTAAKVEARQDQRSKMSEAEIDAQIEEHLR
jgi:hypothetical protein